MADGPRSGRRFVAICAVCCAIFGLVLAASAMPMLVSESPAGDQFNESDDQEMAGEQALAQEQAADSDGTGDEPAEGAPAGALANHADDVDSSILEGAMLGLASILGDDATINPERLDGQFGSMLDSSGDIDPEDVDTEDVDGDIDGDDFDEDDFDEDEFDEEDIEDSDEFDEGEDGHEADDDRDDELSDGDEDGTGDDGPDDDSDADDGSESQDDDGSDTGDGDSEHDADDGDETGSDTGDGDSEHDADDGDETGSDDGDGATDGSDAPDGSDDDSSESDTEDESDADDDATADDETGNDDESDADDSDESDDESADEESATDEDEDDESGLAEMLPGLSGDAVTATLAALAVLAVAYIFYTREDPIGTLRSIPGRLVSLALSSVVACSQALERAVDRLRGLSSIAELPGLVLATLVAALRSAETRVKTAASSVPLFGGETTAETDTVEETRTTARERIRRAFESVIDAAPMYRTRVATATPAEVARGARNAGAPAEPVETITDTFRDVEYGDRDPESYLERTTAAHDELQSALEAQAEAEGEEETADAADPTDDGPTSTGANADE